MSAKNPPLSKQWELYLMDEPVHGVVDIRFGLSVARDACGHPTDAWPRLRSIHIVRRATDDYEFGEWVFRPFKEYWKSGRILLLDPTKQRFVLKDITWEEGFLKRYEESIPHIHTDRHAPQIETLELAVAQLKVNRVQLPTGHSSWHDE